MIRTAVKVTVVTRSDAKHSAVATVPRMSVATHGDWKLGCTRPTALLTTSGHALSRALDQRIRANCSVIARIALSTANKAPMMTMFLNVGPHTWLIRSVRGVALDKY